VWGQDTHLLLVQQLREEGSGLVHGGPGDARGGSPIQRRLHIGREQKTGQEWRE